MIKRKRAARWQHRVCALALLFLGGVDLKAIFEAQGAVDGLRRALRVASSRTPRVCLQALTRGEISDAPELRGPPEQGARFTRLSDHPGVDDLRIDFPEGEVPLRYIFFGQTRHGACLTHWSVPAEGWTHIEHLEEPEKRHKDRHAFFWTRLSIPATQISGSSMEGDDLLLFGVTVEAQPQYSDLARMIAYTYVLKSPARGTRRWNALFIHRCSERDPVAISSSRP